MQRLAWITFTAVFALSVSATLHHSLDQRAREEASVNAQRSHTLAQNSEAISESQIKNLDALSRAIHR